MLARRRIADFSTLLACAVCSACAFDGAGTGSVHWFDQSGAYVVHVRGYGFHVLTIPGDRGLVIGYSERTYIFEKPGTAKVFDASAVSEWAEASNSPLIPIEPVPFAELGEPLAIFSADRGLSLRTNTRSAGLTIGWRRSSNVRLDADADVVFRVDYDSVQPLSTTASYQEYSP